MTNQANTPEGAKLPPAGQPNLENGTATVVVGCKLPSGLFCEVGKPGDDNHAVVRLNGANSSRVFGGYGLTRVSKEFWDKWYGKNKKLDFVKNGMVFVHADETAAAKEAEQRASQRSGFEAVDPFAVVKNRQGEVLLEADMGHFNQARRDVEQATRNRA